MFKTLVVWVGLSMANIFHKYRNSSKEHGNSSMLIKQWTFTFLLECYFLFRCDIRDKRPVCGTDGITYLNSCFLAQEGTCLSNGKIQKARHGECCKNRCSPTSCGRGRKCVWSFKTCTYSCPCQITCANVLCDFFSKCVHDSRTCSTKSVSYTHLTLPTILLV